MTELIPRDVLFGYPEKTAPALSPDGTQIAYLAPSDGVLSVWVRTIGAGDDRVVASDPARPIRNRQTAQCKSTRSQAQTGARRRQLLESRRVPQLPELLQRSSAVLA